MCETGGARWSWLRGVAKISKRYLMQVAAHNLGLVMRRLFGIGTPRSLQGGLGGVFLVLWAVRRRVWQLSRPLEKPWNLTSGDSRSQHCRLLPTA
jgi:transposase